MSVFYNVSVSEKKQINLPKELCEDLYLQRGDGRTLYAVESKNARNAVFLIDEELSNDLLESADVICAINAWYGRPTSLPKELLTILNDSSAPLTLGQDNVIRLFACESYPEDIVDKFNPYNKAGIKIVNPYVIRWNMEFTSLGGQIKNLYRIETGKTIYLDDLQNIIYQRCSGEYRHGDICFYFSSDKITPMAEISVSRSEIFNDRSVMHLRAGNALKEKKEALPHLYLAVAEANSPKETEFLKIQVVQEIGMKLKD